MVNPLNCHRSSNMMPRHLTLTMMLRQLKIITISNLLITMTLSPTNAPQAPMVADKVNLLQLLLVNSDAAAD